MPTLQIRNVPEELYRALKERAKREKRSLNSELTLLLQQALLQEADNRSRRREVLEKIRHQAEALHAYAPADVVSWVREDRER